MIGAGSACTSPGGFRSVSSSWAALDISARAARGSRRRCSSCPSRSCTRSSACRRGTSAACFRSRPAAASRAPPPCTSSQPRRPAGSGSRSLKGGRQLSTPLIPALGARDLLVEQRGLLFVVGVLLFWLVAVLLYLLIAFQASRDAETRALELTLLAREAELRALRAQIDPHFLFNSLNSISALTASDAAAARRMCLLLADFLRATLRLGSNSRITLSDEFDLAERFLAIERVRLGPRLVVARDAEAGVERVPCAAAAPAAARRERGRPRHRSPCRGRHRPDERHARPHPP